MAALTDEQKERFLEFIRSGDDRGKAAEKVGSTGTQFRRMVNPESPRFDPEFAEAFAQACEERGPVKRDTPRPAATPRTTTEQGFTKAAYLTDEDLEEFLELVRDGVPRDAAARQVGTSLSQINRLAGRSGEFGHELREAYKVGLPNFKEKLRGRAYDLAMEGNYSALRDLLLVHDDEYRVLRTQRHEIGGFDGGSLKVLFDRILPNLPVERLDELIRAMEAAEQLEQPRPLRALPGGTDG